MSEAVEANLRPANEQFAEYVDGTLGVCLPPDAPAYVRFWRIMGDVNGARGLKATLISVDCWIDHVKVFIRRDMQGGLKIMVEDAEGKELVGEWQRG